jgi:phosphoglycerol transferase MdoB-like AlkP superfamily enzyme
VGLFFRPVQAGLQNEMLVRLKIPKTILWVVNLFFIFLLIFTLFRFATYFAFKPKDLEFTDLFSSFLLGIRYDLRWIALMLLPVVLVSLVPQLSPFYSARNKKWWTWYLAIVTFIVFFFFAADFGSFSYNQTRLDAGALNFAEDPGISLAMMWQTYPMFWLLMGLVVAVLFFRWMYRQSHWRVISKTDGLGIPYRRKFFYITITLLAVMIYGSLSGYSLKWSKAMTLGDNFKNYLSLNPLQNFFTTLKFRKPGYNEKKAREVFPLMAEWMELKNKSAFSYTRYVLPDSNTLESKPNVVLVLCESFSMYKSSMSGNPLNTTPFFNSLCKDGIFFEKCFTPHFSTARGLFAAITGIPDVQQFKFSTRNPAALTQRTIINDFEGYEKMYFLGGSPEFSNFEGLLKNIDGLQMHTEGKFSSPKINVWGISDKNLFLEANKVFSRQTGPFFSIIQTADNHRPFMIPEEDKDFEKLVLPKDSLSKSGFESPDEFNAFRYSDYCFRKFMEAAQKENYFHNTIFVFVGDHGVAGNAGALYPPAWTSQRLSDQHVPLLFFAPQLLKPERRTEVVSMIDVLPTVAGFIHQPYSNTTLGRDLMHPAKKNHFAFITNSQGRIGLVTDEYYFTMNINLSDNQVAFNPNMQLHSIRSRSLPYNRLQQDSIKRKMNEVTTAMYETAKWMLMNNKKSY